MRDITAQEYEKSKVRVEKYKEGKEIIEGVGNQCNGTTTGRLLNYYEEHIEREEMIQRIYELKQQLRTPV